jgi:hypothetical protein
MLGGGSTELFAAPLTQEPAQAPAPAAEPAQQTAAELQKLVAPIALYPDALVAQILAASTYPTQVVEAERWLQKHSNLQGEQLGREVDQQSWDPSVKALTQFPSVLANLDKNLSWTSALGDAYYNQQQDVLDAVQIMRRHAEDAGNLRTTSQQRVVTQGPTIIIETVDPDYCYLPIYDPWIVYGSRIAPYPGYYYDPWFGPAFVSYGPRIRLGFFVGFGWGWPAWGFNWGSRFVVFNHNRYFSRGHNFSHHLALARGGDRGRFNQGTQFNRSGRALGAANHDRGATLSNRNVDRRSTTVRAERRAQNSRGSNGYGDSRTTTRSVGSNAGRQAAVERGNASRGRASSGGGDRHSSSGGSGRSSGGGSGRSSGGGSGHSSGGGGGHHR